MNPPANPGAGDDIEDLDDNFPSSDAYSPANIGQLKHTATTFWDRLNDLGYSGSPNLGGDYPWTTTTSDDSDYSPCLIGQAKYAFSMDVCYSNIGDIDGDSVTNQADDDIDGDGTKNDADNDIDGDGTYNLFDNDDDGDGTSDSQDDTPSGPTPDTHHAVTITYGVYGSGSKIRMVQDGGPVIWETDDGGSGTRTVMLDTEESYELILTSSSTGTAGTSAGVALAAGPWIPLVDGPNGVVCQATATATNGDSKSIWLKNIKIKEVSFSGTKYYELKSDDVSVTYSAPHWLDKNGDGDTIDTGEHDYSVAYTRNTKPKLKALFKVPGLPSDITLKMRAKGSDSIETPEVTAQISGADVTFPVTESSNAWPNTVKFYNRDDATAFKLDWEIEVGGAWSKVDETKHQVYLTLADPGTTMRQETLFYLSAKNADGKTTAAASFTEIWNEFTDRNVKRIDAVQMKYWDPASSTLGSTVAAMLADTNANGNCDAWAQLLKGTCDAIGVGGTSRIEIESLDRCDTGYSLPPDTTGRGGLLVKDWTFNAGSAPSSCAPYTHLWQTAELTDETGAAAQGNANPHSEFVNHFIVKYDGKYYDPSYGTGSFANQAAWENASLGGFIKAFKPPSGSTTQINAVKSNDTSKIETKFIPTP